MLSPIKAIAFDGTSSENVADHYLAREFKRLQCRSTVECFAKATFLCFTRTHCMSWFLRSLGHHISSPPRNESQISLHLEADINISTPITPGFTSLKYEGNLQSCSTKTSRSCLAPQTLSQPAPISHHTPQDAHHHIHPIFQRSAILERTEIHVTIVTDLATHQSLL